MTGEINLHTEPCALVTNIPPTPLSEGPCVPSSFHGPSLGAAFDQAYFKAVADAERLASPPQKPGKTLTDCLDALLSLQSENIRQPNASEQKIQIAKIINLALVPMNDIWAIGQDEPMSPEHQRSIAAGSNHITALLKNLCATLFEYEKSGVPFRGRGSLVSGANFIIGALKSLSNTLESAPSQDNPPAPAP